LGRYILPLFPYLERTAKLAECNLAPRRSRSGVRDFQNAESSDWIKIDGALIREARPENVFR
jgi:hypothetical protein